MKITLTRTPDPSKILATEPGKLLREFIDYSLAFFELVLRTLRGGISFEDNVNCLVKDLDLTQDTVQTVGVSKPVDMILVGRSYDRDFPVEFLHWYYNDQNELEVKAHFNGSPTVAVKVRVVILFQ